MPIFHLVSCQWVTHFSSVPLYTPTISNCISDKDLHEVTIYEKLFIVFGLAFVLAEYTATRENGWRSRCLIINERPCLIVVPLVYMANVT